MFVGVKIYAAWSENLNISVFQGKFYAHLFIETYLQLHVHHAGKLILDTMKTKTKNKTHTQLQPRSMNSLYINHSSKPD
jgi:hypothetical protein